MDLFQAYQSHCGEVGIWPFLMIVSLSFSSATCSPSQDATEPSSDVTIDRSERISFAVFVVFKPASQGSVEVLADRRHAPPLAPPGLRPDRVLEAVHALLARPFHASLEVVAQEVEAPWPARFHDPRFLRMQGEPFFGHPFPHLLQRCLRLPGTVLRASRP